MKTLTIKIEEELYKSIKINCPKGMKISFFYVELLKKGIKNIGDNNE